jgi:hypothetical protein
MCSTMRLRLGPSSAWRHFSRRTTCAREKSWALRKRVFTMPQRTLVPPMSTARIASYLRSSAGGVRCTQPISPPSSTLCESRPICTCRPASSRMAAVCSTARSPTSLSGKPPPMTMRSTLCHEGWRRKALDHRGQLLGEFLDHAVHHVAGLRGLLRAEHPVELLLAQVARVHVAQRVDAVLAAALAPALQQFPEGRLARLVADEAVLVAQLKAVALHMHAGEFAQPVHIGGGQGIGFRRVRCRGGRLHGDR